MTLSHFFRLFPVLFDKAGMLFISFDELFPVNERAFYFFIKFVGQTDTQILDTQFLVSLSSDLLKYFQLVYITLLKSSNFKNQTKETHQ
jgi:hypothetical protein